MYIGINLTLLLYIHTFTVVLPPLPIRLCLLSQQTSQKIQWSIFGQNIHNYLTCTFCSIYVNSFVILLLKLDIPLWKTVHQNILNTLVSSVLRLEVVCKLVRTIHQQKSSYMVHLQVVGLGRQAIMRQSTLSHTPIKIHTPRTKGCDFFLLISYPFFFI